MIFRFLLAGISKCTTESGGRVWPLQIGTGYIAAKPASEQDRNEVLLFHNYKGEVWRMAKERR